MRKREEYTFCMQQFKPAIIVMAILLVMVLSWSIWHCVKYPKYSNFSLAAANVPTPSAPPVNVKAKMLHPYWGNCSKCHVVTGVGKPVSKVMTGPPISVNDKMLHKYWGNCLLCHVQTDGIPPKKIGPAGQQAAFTQDQTYPLGLKIQTVTADLMNQFALPAKHGALVLDIAVGSPAEMSGFQQGDLIVRFGKNKINTMNDLMTSLTTVKPGQKLKVTIYRGKKRRSLFITIPSTTMPPMTQNQIETRAEQLGVPKTAQAVNQALQQQALQHKQVTNNAMQWVAANAPMTQNQVETLAEQLGVPKTQNAVNQALKKQQGQMAANPFYGKVAIASMGTTLSAPVSMQFDNSPYFIVSDPVQHTYHVVANPNVNDPGNQGVQTAQYMVDLNVENVVSGNYSQNAVNTLHMLRINVYSGVTGSVMDILNAYMSGQLMPEVIQTMQMPIQSPMSGVSPNSGGRVIY
nr:magnetosome protein MamP-like [Desulfobacteraceae bacterium]